jgi:hypothetical protein
LEVDAQDPEEASRIAIRHWRRLSQLAEFAEQGHGYSDNDGGFGVVYPGDLDDYDHEQGEFIPDGFVEIYGFWGPPQGYEVLVPEVIYLCQLASVLSAAGHSAEAERVWSLVEQRRTEPGDAPDRRGM